MAENNYGRNWIDDLRNKTWSIQNVTDTSLPLSSYDSGYDAFSVMTATPAYVFAGAVMTDTDPTDALYARVGGIAAGDVYGGSYGKNVAVDTYVWIESVNKTDAVYGGGQSIFGQGGAVVGDTHVFIDGVNNDQINYVYGGGNKAVVTGNTDVVIASAYVAEVYGGGNNAVVDGDTSVTVYDSGVVKVVGAGNNAGVTGNVSIDVSYSVVTELFGAVDASIGGDINVLVGNDAVNVECSEILGSIYAGVYDKNHTIGRTGKIIGNVDNVISGDVNLTLLNTKIVKEGGYDGYVYGAGHAKVEGDVCVTIVAGSETMQLADLMRYSANVIAGSKTFFNKSVGVIYSTQNTALDLQGGYFTGTFLVAGNAVTAEDGYSYSEGTSTLALSNGAILEYVQAASGAALASRAVVMTNASSLILNNDVPAQADGYGRNSNMIFAGGRTVDGAKNQYQDAVSLTGSTATVMAAGVFRYIHGGGYGVGADVGFDFMNFDYSTPMNAGFAYDDAFVQDYSLYDMAAGESRGTAVQIVLDNSEATSALYAQYVFGGGASGSTVYGDVEMSLNVIGSDASYISNIFGGGNNESVYGDVDIVVSDGTGLRNIYLGSYEVPAETDSAVYGDGTITFTGDKNVSTLLKVNKNWGAKTTLTGTATMGFDNYVLNTESFNGVFNGYDALAFSGNTSVLLGDTTLTKGLADTALLFEVTSETAIATSADDSAMFIYDGASPLAGATDIFVSIEADTSVLQDLSRVNLFDNFSFAEGVTSIKVNAVGMDTFVDVAYLTDAAEDAYTIIQSDPVTGNMFVASAYYVDELLYLNYFVAESPKAADGYTVDYDFFYNKTVGSLYFKDKAYVLGEVTNNDDRTANTFDESTNGFRSLAELTSYVGLYDYQDPNNAVSINVVSIRGGVDDQAAGVNVGRADYTDEATLTQTWTGTVIGVNNPEAAIADQTLVYIHAINIAGNNAWDNQATIYVGENGGLSGVAINYDNNAYNIDNVLTGTFLDGNITNGQVVINDAGYDIRLAMGVSDGNGNYFNGDFSVIAANAEFSDFQYGDSERTRFLNLGGQTDITENLQLTVGVTTEGMIEDTVANFRLADGGYIENVKVINDAWFTNGYTNSFEVENAGQIAAFSFDTDSSTFTALEQMWGGMMGTVPFPTKQDFYYYFYDGVTPNTDPHNPDGPLHTFLDMIATSRPSLYDTITERMKGMHDVAAATSFALTNEATGEIGLEKDGTTINDAALADLWAFGAGSTIVNSGKIYSSILSDDATGADVIDNKATGVIGTDTNSIQIVLGPTGDELSNAGTIYGDALLGDGDNMLTNAGTIYGDVQFGGGEDELSNTGSINGDVQLGAGDDLLSNAGSINGDVQLGAGNDLLSNAGSIDGDALLGAGDDVVELNAGQISDGGAITGILNVGTGNDVINVLGKTNLIGDVVSEGDTLDIVGTTLIADVSFKGELNIGATDADGSLTGSISGTDAAETLNIYGQTILEEGVETIALTGDVELGGGDDVLNAVSYDNKNVKMVGSIVMGEGNDIVLFDVMGEYGSVNLFADADNLGGYLYLGNGDNMLTLAGSTGIDKNVVSGRGNDVINIIGGSIGTHLQTGSGDDIINFDGGAIGGNIEVGAGNDAINLSADLELTGGQVTTKGNLVIESTILNDRNALSGSITALGNGENTLTAIGKLTIEGDIENFENLVLDSTHVAATGEENTDLYLQGAYSATFNNIESVTTSDAFTNSITLLGGYTLVWDNETADLSQAIAINRDAEFGGNGVFTVYANSYEANNYLGTFTDSVIAETFNGLSLQDAEANQWFNFDGGAFGDIFAVNQNAAAGATYGKTMLVTVKGEDFNADLVDGGRDFIADPNSLVSEEFGSKLAIDGAITNMGAEVQNFDSIQIDYNISGLGNWHDIGEVIDNATMTFADGNALTLEKLTLGADAKVLGNVDGALVTFTEETTLKFQSGNEITNNSIGDNTLALQFSDGNDTLRFYGGTIKGGIDMGAGDDVVYIYNTFENNDKFIFGDGADSLFVYSKTLGAAGTKVTSNISGADGLENLVIYNVTDEVSRTNETTVSIDAEITNLNVKLDFTQLSETNPAKQQKYTSEYGVIITENGNLSGISDYTIDLSALLVYANNMEKIVLFSGVNPGETVNFDLNATFTINCSWGSDAPKTTVMNIGDRAEILNKGTQNYGNYDLTYDATAGLIYIKKSSADEGGVYDHTTSVFDLPVPDLNVGDDEISIAATDEATELFNENNPKLTGFLA